MKYSIILIALTFLSLGQMILANQLQAQNKFPSIFTTQINSYFVTSDASHIPDAIKAKKYTDPKKQYFDDAKQVSEYDINLTKEPYYWANNKIPSLENFDKDFKLDKLNIKDLNVLSSKIYYRQAGALPIDQVKIEMEEARLKPFTHMPRTIDAIKYFVLGYTIPQGVESVPVRHSFIEICTKSAQYDKYLRFYVDRGSRESIISDLWATRVRIIYIGETSSCDLQSNTWLIDEVAQTNNVSHITLIDQANVGENIFMSEIIELGKKYAMKFPVYNTLINCQHFAFNLYNQLTRKNLDYVSNEIMGDHSDASGLQTEKSIRFGIQLGEKQNLENNYQRKFLMIN